MNLLQRLAEAIKMDALPTFLAQEKVSMEWVEKVRGANGFLIFMRQA
jgi:hypothetical protein